MSDLSDIDKQLRKHALLCSIGFIILLPLGALVGRYLRTFTGRWFWAHSFLQFLVAGPVIFAGWYYGYHSTSALNTGGHFVDPHKWRGCKPDHTEIRRHVGALSFFQKIGLALLILYLAQIVIGWSIHTFKTPHFLGGRRPPQNYFHAVLGLAIIALAAYQVHYGLITEWYEATGDGTVVPRKAKNAWIALTVIFWSLYVIGLAFLPRQYSQEAAVRKEVPKA